MRKKLEGKDRGKISLSLLIAFVALALYEYVLLLPNDVFLDFQQTFAYSSFIASITLLAYFIFKKNTLRQFF